MLVQQLEEVLAEVEGAQLDADVFAQMGPDDAALVRGALGLDVEAEPDEEAEPDDDGFEFSLDFDDADEAEASETEDDQEEEIARLKAEIESSGRVQAALGTYLELLSAPPGRVTDPI